jgi:hypothetical protein
MIIVSPLSGERRQEGSFRTTRRTDQIDAMRFHVQVAVAHDIGQHDPPRRWIRQPSILSEVMQREEGRV